MSDDPIVTEGIRKACYINELQKVLGKAVAAELCIWAICTRYGHEPENIAEWGRCQERRAFIEAEIKKNLPF